MSVKGERACLLRMCSFFYICIFIHDKKLHFLFICPLRTRKGGGHNALADMSAKNVCFFGRLPLTFNLIYTSAFSSSKVTDHIQGESKNIPGS